MLFKIGLRNILRNGRRSAVTGLAVAVGAMALLLFGAFQAYIFAGYQTGVVQRVGHLTVFHNGYFLYGAGNPAAYGIDDYAAVMRVIGEDPVLKPLVKVMTPTLSLFGIAGNFQGENDAAKTFLGVGVVPSDRQRMLQWDEYGASRPFHPDTRLADDDATRGLIGVGLARILNLCAALKIADCPPAPAAKPREEAAASAPAKEDFSDLAEKDVAANSDPNAKLPRIDLLAATAGGAPNVVSLYVSGAESQGVKELDDNYIGMHLALAQQLLYGRGAHKVTGIELQLHRSEDMAAARARLDALFREKGLDLEVRDFAERTPQYSQTLNFFRAIFLFIAVVMGVIVLFAVVNTMTMTVMERTNEIGTTRAMGVRRSGIRRQFLVEGWMLGAMGATGGVVLAVIAAVLVNRSGLTWTPPGNVSPVPFRLDLFTDHALILSTWVGLVLVATIAALIPANRAAKLQVVDALRHV
ncbi:MAG TPA: FtsX-like permease family protein [Stellaceae bacterium]|nr:FtsX-like permease family protein [Stellaceae bacterium]